MIKWTKGDAIRLGRAIAEFNRAVKELENELNKLYLPELKEYRVVRESLKTRAELNRIIKSMQRFSKYTTSADLVTTESGEVMTKWEKKELNYARAGLLRKVNSELKKIETAEKPYRSDKQKELEVERQRLRDLFTLTGEDFTRAKNQVLRKASKDYELNRLITYKNNYMKTLEKYQNFNNYEELISYMKKLSPKAFYDKSQSTPALDDLTLLSDQSMAQNEFNNFVEEWLGVDDMEDTQEI